jgi:hypothetical protein
MDVLASETDAIIRKRRIKECLIKSKQAHGVLVKTISLIVKAPRTMLPSHHHSLRGTLEKPLKLEFEFVTLLDQIVLLR